jgi:hypothetical protein
MIAAELDSPDPSGVLRFDLERPLSDVGSPVPNCGLPED